VSTRFEWDPEKATTNFKKHAVRFTEAEAVFHDDHAITIPDEESDGTEKRFVTLGMGLKAVFLVVVYCYRVRRSGSSLPDMQNRTSAGTTRNPDEELLQFRGWKAGTSCGGSGASREDAHHDPPG
jgi:uncharacterized protein